MTLSIKELKELSEVDTNYDINKVDMYVIELAKISSKWTRLLFDEKLVYESLSIQYDVLKKKKYEKYLYDYKYVIEKRGGEINIYLNSDPELLEIKEKLSISKEKMLFIESIIKVLNSAGFNIKNYIEWQKFMAGSY